MSTHSESNIKSKPGHGEDHPFKVTVRSLAGHSDQITAKPSDTIAELRDKEVKHFVSKGWLAPGEYALTLPRASGADLDPTATLHDLGVVESDVLVLINRQPQVDGGTRSSEIAETSTSDLPATA